MTARRCSRCGETKQLNEFVRNRSAPAGYGYHCRPCHNRVSRQNREKHHGTIRDFMLRRRYGIDAAEVERLLLSQGGSCAICGANAPRHLDHDHTSGRVRGVLCFSCNGALGQFSDDVATLRRARAYLEQPRLISFSEGLGRPAGLRVCLGCRQRKQHVEFVVGRPTGSLGPPFCWKCFDDPKAAPLVNRHYRLRRRYGIGLEEFVRLVELQEGTCAVCCIAPALHVDHDHERRVVRGILCGGCNTGMGQFHDDPAIIRRAIDYLYRHRPHDVQEPAAPYILSVA